MQHSASELEMSLLRFCGRKFFRNVGITATLVGKVFRETVSTAKNCSTHPCAKHNTRELQNFPSAIQNMFHADKPCAIV
jgi:hypothetical protein